MKGGLEHQAWALEPSRVLDVFYSGPRGLPRMTTSHSIADSAKPFLDVDFLLETKTAIELYREFAAPQPIIDYHCHLLPTRSRTITASER